MRSGAFWVFQSMLSSTKKSTIFRIINQQPNFCAIFFSKISPEINTITCYKGSGDNDPLKPNKWKKWRFLHQILHMRRVESPVMMWIQIRARGGGGVQGHASPWNHLLKWCNLAHSECFKICYYQPKYQTKNQQILHNSKNDLPWSVSNTNLG